MTTATVPPPAPGSLAPGKPTRILACVLCQHRKIKCDRTFPCANCIKAKVTCTPSTPAPARKRRRPNQDLQERLARCEDLLKEYASAKPEGEDGDSQMSNSHANEDYKEWQPNGKLIVEDDGGVRFVDSLLLGTVHEELRAMRQIIDEEDNEDITPDATLPDDNGDLLMPVDSPSMCTDDLKPAPNHVFQLWQIYLERCNPLSKVIHAPSLQQHVVEATSRSKTAKGSVEALLFAIYTLASIAMTPDECLNVLGMTKDVATNRFSLGVRISLNKLNFLKNHDLETLQALVIYLISLHGRYNKHAAWILNGTVIRIAQKMGLHRDGEALGLSPFETEMRRRIWWQIVMLDAKYAMMSGLSNSLLPGDCDTKEPKNINDADLFPSATEPIQDREGPTEMIMVLLTSRVARFFTETKGIEPLIFITDELTPQLPNGPDQEQLQQYHEIVRDLGRRLLDILDRYCDPSAGPLHQLAHDVRTEILTKLATVADPPKIKPSAADSPEDIAFKISIKACKHGIEELARTEGRGFEWFARTHFQPNIFLYLVGQICTRIHHSPADRGGPLAEKAWDLVEQSYACYPQLYDISQRIHFQIARLTLRAWRRREASLIEHAGIGSTMVPEFVTRLQMVVPQDDSVKSEMTGSDAISRISGTGSAVDVSPRALDVEKMSLMDNSHLDTFMQPYVDGQLDWDIWAGIPGGATMPFGSFGVGPSTEW